MDFKVDGTFIVTGANSGIGKQTATDIAKRGGRVIMLCRNRDRGEKARQEIVAATGSDSVELCIVDVSDAASVRTFAEEFLSRDEPIKALVNNAGAIPPTRLESPQGLEMAMAIAMGGSYLLTGLLMPALRRGAPSRVVNVSSGGAYGVQLDVSDPHFDRKTYDGVLAYAYAKRAQIIVSEHFARTFPHQSSGVSFHAVHPGWCDTPGVQTSIPTFRERMQEDLRDLPQGADSISWLAMSPEVDPATSGAFWFDRQQAPKHMPLAGTESSGSDRVKFLTMLAEKFNWELAEQAE